jgi:hypothetical protein
MHRPCPLYPNIAVNSRPAEPECRFGAKNVRFASQYRTLDDGVGMSALGYKRTWRREFVMSALPPTADIRQYE